MPVVYGTSGVDRFQMSRIWIHLHMCTCMMLIFFDSVCVCVCLYTYLFVVSLCWPLFHSGTLDGFSSSLRFFLGRFWFQILHSLFVAWHVDPQGDGGTFHGRFCQGDLWGSWQTVDFSEKSHPHSGRWSWILTVVMKANTGCVFLVNPSKVKWSCCRVI